MTQPKVVHLIVGLSMGGAESMLYKLLSEESKNKSMEDVAVISLIDEGVFGEKLRDLGVKVYALGMTPRKFSFTKSLGLIRLFKCLKADIMVCWMYHAMFVGALLKLISGSHFQLVWNIRHALQDRSKEKKLTLVLIKLGAYLSILPKKILCNSHIILKQHKALGYREKKLLMIPNGFNIDLYQVHKPTHNILIEELDLPDDARIVGMIARYHHIKGQEYFIDAARMISEECDNTYFVLIGRDVNYENTELLSWINATSYKERFFLLGEINDIHKVLPNFSVLVNSSTSEAFPNVIGEAMLSQVPCVVTDVGDSAHIVGQYGLVVEPKKPKEISDAVLEILSWDNNKLSMCKRQSRQRIIENYSIESVGEKYQALYHELVN